MSLLVPMPQLQQNGSAPPILVSEKPITLACAPVLFSDGSTLTPLNIVMSNFLLYRKLFGGTLEVWDSQAKSWVAPGSSIAPQALFWNDNLKSWQSIIVAMGSVDSGGNPTFATDPATGFPKYLVQCSFSGKDSTGAQQDSQSPFSAPAMILAPGQNNVAGLSMDPNDPAKATEIEIFLKDSSLVEQGRIVIFQDSSGFHVQLNAGGASLLLSNTGDIVLSPSNSRAVQVNGSIAVSGQVLIGGVPVVAP